MVHMVEQMAYAGETPWHSLGKKVLHDLTARQMMEEAGLDWTVEKYPAYAEVNGVKIASGTSLLVRSSDLKVLDTVTDDWEPVQNEQAFEFFKEFIDRGDMKMNTAGSLRGGQVVWALAKVKESFELFKGKDLIESYLLFTNPHRFGQSTNIRFTPTRVVCWNTLSLALNESAEYSVKASHRTAFDAERVKETLGIAKFKLGEYKEAAEFLSTKNMKGSEYLEYLKSLYPVMTKGESKKELSKPAKTIASVLESQPGAELGEGTWWQGFNSVTYYVDHLAARTNDNRLDSAWYGHGRKMKIAALKKAVEFAEAA